MKDYYPIKFAPTIDLEPRIYPREEWPYKTDAEEVDVIPHPQKPTWNRAVVRRLSKKYEGCSKEPIPRDTSPFEGFSRHALGEPKDNKEENVFVEQNLAYLNDPMNVVMQKPNIDDFNPIIELNRNPDQTKEMRDKGSEFLNLQNDENYLNVKQKPILGAQTIWKKGTYVSSHDFYQAFGINEPKKIEFVGEQDYIFSPKKREHHIVAHEHIYTTDKMANPHYKNNASEEAGQKPMSAMKADYQKYSDAEKKFCYPSQIVSEIKNVQKQSINENPVTKDGKFIDLEDYTDNQEGRQTNDKLQTFVEKEIK